MRPEGQRSKDFTKKHYCSFIDSQNNLNETINFTLSDSGRTTHKQIKSAGGTILHQNQYVYDTLGRVIQSITGEDTATTALTYDVMSQVTETAYPPLSGSTTTNKVIQGFDALGRVISSKNPLNQTTNFAYDNSGNLTTVTDPKGVTTTYTYNGFGEVLSEASPDTGTTTYTRDERGNVATKTDANGVVTTYTYDELNRLKREAYTNSAANGQMNYYYDAVGTVTLPNKGIGRLTSFDEKNASGTVLSSGNLIYDKMGRVTRRLQIVNGINYYTYFEYDLSGLLTKITYPSGHIVNYTYDSAGQPTTITYQQTSASTPVTVATNIQYRPFGPFYYAQLGNNLLLNNTIDKDYRVTRVRTYNYSGTAPTSPTPYAGDLDVVFDESSNVVQLNDLFNSAENQTFTYNAAFRLTKAVGSYGTVLYAYDANGNRTIRNDNGVAENYTYTTGTNRLASTNLPRTFSYDANGNMTFDDRGTSNDLTLTYNNKDRLKSATVTASDTASYLYNMFGERISRTLTSTGGTTHYQYLNGRLMAESNGATGVVSREIIYLGTLPIAQIRTVTGGATSLYWFHTDHQGTPIAMTDSTGLKVWGRSQEPFGENNASYNPVGVFTTTRFDGQFLDSLTGLHYNLMRDYDPSTGRYITADPIGLNGGRNRYGYALGNPATYTDPRGEYAFALIPVVSFVGLLLINEVFGDAWRKAAVGDAIEKTLYALGDDLSSLGANVRDMIGDSMINTEMGQSIYDYIFNQEENAGGQSTTNEESVETGQVCKPETKTYETYTKNNPETGEVYTGRTSGTKGAEGNVKDRDRNHHMNDKGFGAANPDKSSPNPDAIRGREQQLIDKNGGAKSQGGTSGNSINGISPSNPNRGGYIGAAEREFGK